MYFHYSCPLDLWLASSPRPMHSDSQLFLECCMLKSNIDLLNLGVGPSHERPTSAGRLYIAAGCEGLAIVIRGEPERAPNTRETGSGVYIYIYIYIICYSYSTGPGIYGSKPTRVRGRSPRTRAVYVAINPWQPCYNYYISHLIGPKCGART